MKTKPWTLVAVVILLACNDTPAGRRTYASIDEGVASVVGVNGGGWHVGTNADCLNPFLKDMLATDPAYEAYGVRGDLNGDGHPEYAFVLVRGDSGRLYWMMGREAGYDEPQLVTTVDWIRDGGLVVKDRMLFLGKFYSDDGFAWTWNPSTKALELFTEIPGSEG